MVEVVTARSFSDKIPPLGASSTSDRTPSKIICTWIHSSSRVAISAINPRRPPSFTSFGSSTSQSSPIEFYRMLEIVQTRGLMTQIVQPGLIVRWPLTLLILIQFYELLRASAKKVDSPKDTVLGCGGIVFTFCSHCWKMCLSIPVTRLDKHTVCGLEVVTKVSIRCFFYAFKCKISVLKVACVSPCWPPVLNAVLLFFHVIYTSRRRLKVFCILLLILRVPTL